MPFEKGVSGNKHGAPAGRKQKQLAELLSKGLSPSEAVKRFIQHMESCDSESFLPAFREYFDRVYGKAPQAIDMQTSGEVTVVFKEK